MNKPNKKNPTRTLEPYTPDVEKDNLNREQRMKFLLDLLGQMQSNRKVNEELEHKVAFAVTALLIGLAAYVVKGEYVLNIRVRTSLALFSIAMTLLTIWFLLRNGARVRFQCKVIVRIEQALGLYDENLFMSSERVKKAGYKPYREATIYPLEAQKYGEGDWALVLTPHILVVLFAGLIACAVVLFDTNPASAPQRNAVSRKTTQQPNNALQRRPRSAVLMGSFDPVRGPAERGRYVAPRDRYMAYFSLCQIGLKDSVVCVVVLESYPLSIFLRKKLSMTILNF